MQIDYHVKGIARKRLACQISEFVHDKVQYCGSPGYEYKIGPFAIDQNGALYLPDEMDNRRLLQWLSGLGYASSAAEQQPVNQRKGTIAYPRCDFTPQSLDNLRALIENKASLIMKALGVDSLPVEICSDSVRFPWLPETVDDRTSKAVRHFISALCDMSRKQQSIRAGLHAVDNEKYAFRCFLLRLGFIGAEYRDDRQILLARLSGNAAFKESTNE